MPTTPPTGLIDRCHRPRDISSTADEYVTHSPCSVGCFVFHKFYSALVDENREKKIALIQPRPEALSAKPIDPFGIEVVTCVETRHIGSSNRSALGCCCFDDGRRDWPTAKTHKKGSPIGVNLIKRPGLSL